MLLSGSPMTRPKGPSFGGKGVLALHCHQLQQRWQLHGCLGDIGECGCGVPNVVRASPTQYGVADCLHVRGVVSALFILLGLTMDHCTVNLGVGSQALFFTYIGVQISMSHRGAGGVGCDLAGELGCVVGGVSIPMAVRGANSGRENSPSSQPQIDSSSCWFIFIHWGGGGV